jgi:hypothetical protein
LALALWALSMPVVAQNPLTLSYPTNFRDITGPNILTFTVGDVQRIGVSVSHSDRATTVTAAQGGTVLTLDQVASPLLTDSYAAVIPFDPALVGPWTITVIRGTESASIVTPGLPVAVPMPFGVDPLVVDERQAPRLTWVWPDFGEALAAGLTLSVDIGVYDVEHREEFGLSWGAIAPGSPGEVFSAAVPPGLEPGRLYAVVVVVVGKDADGNVLSRSSTFGRRPFVAL